MPKITKAYGEKAAYLDFYLDKKSTEEMAALWAPTPALNEFFSHQRGVSGKLKYWNFQRVHFPAIDNWLKNILDEAYRNAKGNSVRTLEVKERHPVSRILTPKIGTNELVWPIWIVSTKPSGPGPDEIVYAPCNIIEHAQQEDCEWGELAESLPSKEIFATNILGLTEPNPKGDQFAPSLTDAGELLGWDSIYTDHETTDNDHFWSITASDSAASAVSFAAYEIINHFFAKCVKDREMPHLRSINQYHDIHQGREREWRDETSLKNFRLPYSHIRILEETADFLNTNNINVVTKLIRDHCGEIVIGSVRNVLEHDPASIEGQQNRFKLWKDAIKDFVAGVGGKMPESLEEAHALIEAAAAERRKEKDNSAIEDLYKNFSELKLSLEAVKKAQENRTIDGGTFGDEPGGNVILHDKEGFKAKRVSTLNYANWKNANRRIDSVMDAYAHAAKPFSFRDTGPTLVRVGQAQFSRDQGSTTDMTVEDCVGYKIKATKKEKVADIIEEFNQTLHNHFNYPTEPMIVWSEDKITLTKDWVDFANQFPLEVLESGQKYVIPDPRSLPDGNPATSVFATQEE